MTQRKWNKESRSVWEFGLINSTEPKLLVPLNRMDQE